MNLKKLHTIVGVITVLIFLATGVYMSVNFPDIYSSNEIIRYQFRTNHIYILMIGLVNLVAGLYVRPDYKNFRAIVSYLSSFILCTATLLLIIAFFTEPVQGLPIRPFSFYGIILSITGVFLMYLPRIRFKEKV